MKILKEVLDDIKPTKEEEEKVFSKIDDFLKNVNKGLKGAKAVLGGSGAKGTWLKHAHDADIFVEFDKSKYEDKSSRLSDILEKHLKKRFKKVDRLHGSRDYFQIKQKDFTFEIVPILKIDKAQEAVNITDVSMLHSRWVNKHKKYCDEIRLTKQFCKAQKVYGAESYINGFSGYICEILTIHHKGFMKLVKAALKWKPKVFIDTQKYYKNKNEIMFNLNNSKLESPVIVVDPVDKDRNAAAALNNEKFDNFVRSCKELIKNPKKDKFYPEKIDKEKIEKRFSKYNVIFLNVKTKKGKEDVIGCKLLKVFEHIHKKIEENEFKIKDKGWEFDKEDKAVMWFVTDNKKLSEEVNVCGPPIDMKEHVKAFKKKYKKTDVVKGKVYATVKRKYDNADKLVKDLIKDKYVKDKVKSISF